MTRFLTVDPTVRWLQPQGCCGGRAFRGGHPTDRQPVSSCHRLFGTVSGDLRSYLRYWRQPDDQPTVAVRGYSPAFGGGTATPPSAYSFSLLRRVRIEMPRMLAAWVRLPRQCFNVSRIRSRSTSATVRPTSARVTCSAANVACATAGCVLATSSRSPSGDR